VQCGWSVLPLSPWSRSCCTASSGGSPSGQPMKEGLRTGVMLFCFPWQLYVSKVPTAILLSLPGAMPTPHYLIQHHFLSHRIDTGSARRRWTHHLHHALRRCDSPVHIILCLHSRFAPVHYELHSHSWGPVPQRNGPGGDGHRLQPSLLFGTASEHTL
jgi:hypothetical protein